MKTLLCYFFTFIIITSTEFARSQQIDSIPTKQKELEEVRVSKDYLKKYKTNLRRVKRVYPLALYAAKQIKELDQELNEINSKHKKKKIAKEVNQELRDNFQFVIRDLYIEEGKLLMKLIHRETGMTVAQIIKKYRGGFRSELHDNLGKLWQQDLDATYDPKGEDWIIEQIIQEIDGKQIAFEPDPKKLTKEEFKDKQKQYKIDKKDAKKAMRAKRKSGSE